MTEDAMSFSGSFNKDTLNSVIMEVVLDNILDVIRMTVLDLGKRKKIWTMQLHFL